MFITGIRTLFLAVQRAFCSLLLRSYLNGTNVHSSQGLECNKAGSENATDCKDDHANPFSAKAYNLWDLLLKSLYFCMALQAYLGREVTSPYLLNT
jgi:hypothetical protein